MIAEGRIHLSEGRWYRTGDLGYFDGTGKLHLLGRASSCMNLGDGRAILPVEYENSLTSELHGLVKHAVLAVGGRQMKALYFIVNVAPPENPSDEDVEDKILASGAWKRLIEAVSGEDGEAGCERGSVILVLSEDDWNVTNGLVTGSQKVARKRVIEKFGKE